MGIIAALKLSLIGLAIRVADEVGGVQKPSRLHRFADLSHRPPHRAPQRRGHLYRGMKGVAGGERIFGTEGSIGCRDVIFLGGNGLPCSCQGLGSENGGFRDVGRVGRAAVDWGARRVTYVGEGGLICIGKLSVVVLSSDADSGIGGGNLVGMAGAILASGRSDFTDLGLAVGYRVARFVPSLSLVFR